MWRQLKEGTLTQIHPNFLLNLISCYNKVKMLCRTYVITLSNPSVNESRLTVVMIQPTRPFPPVYGLDDWKFEPWQGMGIFLFTTTSRLALGPTQPPIQLVAGPLSLGVKRPGLEAGHSPSPSAEVKEWVELYLRSPIHLHGVLLS
jgi:hypothetical protein